MSNFSQKFIVEILIFTIVIGALLAGLLFLRSNIVKAVSQINKDKQSFEDRTSSIERFTLLKSQYDAKGKTYFNIFQNIILSKDEIIDVRRDFQALVLAKNLDYDFNFTGEETPPSEGTLGSQKFRLSVEGSTLDQLFDFVRSIENFKHLTTLESLSVSRRDTLKHMDLDGQIFFRL